MATARANVQGEATTFASSAAPDASIPAGTFDVASAYEFCARLAKSHYENFTVASWLMPREMRPHMHAIYAYARIADDFADEDHDLAKLDEWERELDLRMPARRAIRCSSRWPIPCAASIFRASRSPIC